MIFMQYLIERIGANKCRIHNRPIEYLCYQKQWNHPYRRMCENCFGMGESSVYKSVKQITEFLEQYQLPIEAILRKLKQNEEIKVCISKIFKYRQISKLYKHCKDRPMTGSHVELLGRLLSRTIRVNRKQQICFRRLNPNLGLYLCNRLIDQQIIVGTAIQRIQQAFQQIKVIMAQFVLKQVIWLEGNINWIQISPNQQLLAISINGSILLYDVNLTTKRIILNDTLSYENCLVHKMAFNADSTMLAACGENSQIKVWHLNSNNNKWRLFNQIYQNTSCITTVNFNHNCNELISGNCSDGTAKFYLRASSRWKLHRKLWGGQVWFNDIIISPNSKYLAIGGDELTIHPIPINNQMKQVLYTKPVEDLSNSVTIAFNKESNLLISGRDMVDAVIWRLNTITNDWEYEQSLPNTSGNEIYNVLFNSQSNMIIASFIGPIINVWKRNRQNVWVLNYKLDMNGMGIVKSVITSDSTMLISMNNYNYIFVHVQDI